MHSLTDKFSILKYDFYLNDTAKVAKNLLGKLLIRKSGDKILIGRIVETEAYYGIDDPASRAYKGVNKISELMFGPPGRLLVYVVHANYLINIISHQSNKVGAVLIRAIEPVFGIEKMRENRRVETNLQLCSGPGKLTKALGINKNHHGLDVTKENSEIVVVKNSRGNEKFEVIESFRIGVKKDLPRKLRFYIKDNEHVSRK